MTETKRRIRCFQKLIFQNVSRPIGPIRIILLNYSIQLFIRTILCSCIEYK